MWRANVMTWRPFALGLALVASTACSAGAGEFKSNWDKTPDRVWIGPDWWANRAGDWRIHDGRLECVQPGMRAAYLTTRTLRGSFQLSVRTGMLGKPDSLDQCGFTGFFFSNMGKDNYKTEDLLRSSTSLKTFLAGLDSESRLMVFLTRDAGMVSKKQLARHENEDIRLEFRAVPVGKGYSLEFAAFDHKTGKLLDRLPLDGDDEYPPDLPRPIDGEFPAEPLNGYVALIAGSPSATDGGEPRTPLRYWYRDFELSGKDVETHAEGDGIQRETPSSTGQPPKVAPEGRKVDDPQARPDKHSEVWRRTHRALGQRLPAVEFIECPLEVVLSFFREVLEAEIRPDWAALKRIGVTEATMADFYARGLAGRRALELTMASTVGLGQIECVVGEDGIVHIRPAGAAPLPMRAKATDTQLAVRKRLAAKEVARLNLRDTKLSDVITFLRELSDVDIFVDWHSLRRIKVDHHSKVRLDLTDKPVCDALTAALHAVSSNKALRWEVDAEGVVLIHAMPRTMD